METRRRSAIIWTMLALGILVILSAFHIPDVYMLLALPPATLSSLEIMQWYYKFSVSYGLTGVYNISSVEKQCTRITDQKYIMADSRFAWELIAKSICCGLAYAILAIILF